MIDLLVAVTGLEEPTSWTDYLESAGLLGGSLLLVWALLTERLVPGRVYRRSIDEERERTAEALALLRQALGTTERSVEKMR